MLLSQVFKNLQSSPHDSSLIYNNTFFSPYSAEKLFYLILDQILKGDVPYPLLVKTLSSSITLDPESALSFLTELQIQLFGIGLHVAFKDRPPLPETFLLPYRKPEDDNSLLELFGYIYSGHQDFSRIITYRAVFLPDNEIFLLVSGQNLEGTVLFIVPSDTYFPLEALPGHIRISPDGYKDLLLISAILDHIVGKRTLPLSHFVLFSDDERKNSLIWVAPEEKIFEWSAFFNQNIEALKRAPESFLNSILFSPEELM